MTSVSRFAIAIALVAGFGGIAHAQSQRSQVVPDQYYALSDEGRGGVFDRATVSSGAVPPSESQTVMGLRVPR